MIKGVNAKEEIIIKSILANYPYKFFYYGSRVKGNFTKGSDLDILLVSENSVPSDIIEKIELEFNKSLIPYVVNISDYNKLDKSFYNLIEPSLVKI